MSNLIAVTPIGRRSSGAQIKKKVRKKYIQNRNKKKVEKQFSHVHVYLHHLKTS